MNFSWALNELKAGKLVTRSGWNGKDMYVYLVPSSRFVVNRPPLSLIIERGGQVDYLGHLDMRTATGEHATWHATDADLLADDWAVTA